MGGYVRWQLWEGPAFILALLSNIEAMLIRMFSTRLMLQTLFSYWHRDAVAYRGGVGDILLAVIWNVISRIIGFLVRGTVLITWAVTSLVVAIALSILCVFFITWPALTIYVLLVGFTHGSWVYVLSACASMLLLAWAYERTRNEYVAGPSISQEAHSFADLAQTLKKHPDSQEFFSRCMIPLSDIDSFIEQIQSSGTFWDTFIQDIATQDVISVCATLCLHPALRQRMQAYTLREDDIAFVAWWLHERAEQRKEAATWWSREHFLNVSGVGISWAAGYTPLIDIWSRIPRGELWDVPYGHEEEVHSLTTSLARRSQSNVLLVGQAGAGRLGVVRRVAKEIAVSSTHAALHNLRVVYIHLGELLALGSTVPEQLQIIAHGLGEMERAGNIVAVLDGAGSVLGDSQEGQLNATDILLPFLTSHNVRTVIMMSDEEYDARIAPNEEVAHLFDVVRVKPLSEDDTLHLLALAVPVWEGEGGIYIPYQTLREVISRTSTILPNVPYPERAFDIMEEVIADVRGGIQDTQTVHLLLPEEVTAVVSRKMGFDISQMAAMDTSLLNLEDVIHERVVNQSEAVRAVAHAMVRARADVRNTKRPIGTFLFLGPTGVGKTETAKALSEAYFGQGEPIVRLDMQQFQDIDALLPQLTSRIEAHPFSVLLLDEFEKASLQVQQLFLSIFDEGYIRDARGRIYACTHMIIIATSNAGSQLIRRSVASDGTLPQGFGATLTEHILAENIFTPELLNRFDGVITFTPLTREHIREVARRMLIALNMRLDEQHGVGVEITDELLEYLGTVGFNPEFGARPMARAIQDSVEYEVGEAILKGSLVAGQTLRIDPKQFTSSQTS